jgi:hypothetical protein
VTGFIRLAPDHTEAVLGLSKDEAIAEANAAFRRAKSAQAELVSQLGLTGRLADPGMVNRAKLRGMRREAEEQVERAQAVVLALIDSADALERYRAPEVQS